MSRSGRFTALRRRASAEGGYAMVIAITLTSIMMVFTIGMLSTGLHLEQATVRDADWNKALQVAEAAVDNTMYQLTSNSSYPGTGSTPLVIAGGEADVVVVEEQAGYITVYATGYVPTKTDFSARRRIKVEYGPEDVFDFALFSTTSLTLKNNGVTHGDVFANNSIYFENNSVVYGSATAATGTIELTNGAALRKEDDRLGNAYTGGYDATGKWGLYLHNNAEVEGDAFAQAESCPDPEDPGDDGRYDIVSDGSVDGGIKGNATARGSISGTVGGTRSPFICQNRASLRQLPPFNTDYDLYDDEIVFDDLTTFNTWLSANQSALSGVVFVQPDSCADYPYDAASVINMNGATVVDDFVFVTNCRIDANNNFTVTAPSDSIVNIVVLNDSSDPAAVTIKNNLTVENDAAVLFYSTGLLDVKNNLDEQGAVYSGAIAVKNNLDVVFDPRVQRSLGFGDLKYDRMSWQECKAAATGTDC